MATPRNQRPDLIMCKLSILASLFITLLLTGSLEAKEIRKNVTTLKLENGLNLVLIENHSSPMIASVVTVNAGSVNETAEINGISHMLEHLLFNGTTTRTQEQLYHEQDYYGIYNNAHTDRDYTNYIVLVEKDFIEKALDIQSDMLFHSTFPEDKFEKEKGIILNELARDSANDSYWVGEFFDRKFYRKTPYNLTVLGTAGSIKGMTRDQVKNYYNTFYKPNNMTALVMGDFEPDAMIAYFEKYFGKTGPGKIPKPQSFKLDPSIFGKTFLQEIRSRNSYLTLGFAAPEVGSKDFFAFDLLIRIMNQQMKNEINGLLKEKNIPQLLGISSDFNFSKSLSAFSISAVLPPGAETESVKKEITRYLKQFINRKFEKKEIKGLLTSLNVNEQFLFERPHYFGMMKGSWLAAGGWEFTNSYIDNLETVSVGNLRRAAQKYFKDPKFVTSITSPGDQEPQHAPQEYFNPESKEVLFTKESIRLAESWRKVEKFVKEQEIEKDQPASPSNAKRGSKDRKQSKISFHLSDRSGKRKFEKTTYKNGLTLLINSNPDSSVFAVHLLAKNRTALEPEGKEGIADFLHRLMERRTGTKNKKELKDALNAIGASLKTRDNPYIPYDNYYTSREFSFIRFQTIDDFQREAVNVFSDIVLDPSFLEGDIEEVKAEMTSLIQKENKKPSRITANRMYEELFNKNRFSRRINGTEETVSSITRKDLEDFYRYYFAPNNLIISISTSLDRNLVLKEFDKYFKNLEAAKVPKLSLEAYPEVSKGKSEKILTNKSQSYVRLGTLFKMNKEDEAGFRVLASVLSQNLSHNIREKKGLAYSLGAGFGTHKGYGLFQIAVGTKAETLDKVETEIYREIEKIKKEVISENRLNKLINTYNSRRLMRSLTRISQCYQAGLSEFYGKPFDHNETLLQKIKKLKPTKIQKLAERYLIPENMVKIIAE